MADKDRRKCFLLSKLVSIQSGGGLGGKRLKRRIGFVTEGLLLVCYSPVSKIGRIIFELVTSCLKFVTRSGGGMDKGVLRVDVFADF